MAGSDGALGGYQCSEGTGWVTGFKDVDGTFHPYAQNAREEPASVHANYARAMGKFEISSHGALDGMSDMGTVSVRATDNVAWAIENGMMGSGGFVAGQSSIIRA